jgi:hypothetical protein
MQLILIFSNQINDFLRENDIQKIIDIKYSSFKRDDNTNEYSALLIHRIVRVIMTTKAKVISPKNGFSGPSLLRHKTIWCG